MLSIFYLIILSDLLHIKRPLFDLSNLERPPHLKIFSSLSVSPESALFTPVNSLSSGYPQFRDDTYMYDTQIIKLSKYYTYFS
jgi:hypothetical protein